MKKFKVADWIKKDGKVVKIIEINNHILCEAFEYKILTFENQILKCKKASKKEIITYFQNLFYDYPFLINKHKKIDFSVLSTNSITHESLENLYNNIIEFNDMCYKKYKILPYITHINFQLYENIPLDCIKKMIYYLKNNDVC